MRLCSVSYSAKRHDDSNFLGICAVEVSNGCDLKSQYPKIMEEIMHKLPEIAYCQITSIDPMGATGH